MHNVDVVMLLIVMLRLTVTVGLMFRLLLNFVILLMLILSCGGTGIHSSIPTKTVQVPITTGTVTDSGSVNTGLLVALGRYIYRHGRL